MNGTFMEYITASIQDNVGHVNGVKYSVTSSVTFNATVINDLPVIMYRSYKLGIEPNLFNTNWDNFCRAGSLDMSPLCFNDFFKSIQNKSLKMAKSAAWDTILLTLYPMTNNKLMMA